MRQRVRIRTREWVSVLGLELGSEIALTKSSVPRSRSLDMGYVAYMLSVLDSDSSRLRYTAIKGIMNILYAL